MKRKSILIIILMILSIGILFADFYIQEIKDKNSGNANSVKKTNVNNTNTEF